MAHTRKHDYHILPPSIWPFSGALGAFIMAYGAVQWFSPNVENNTFWIFGVGLAIVLYTMFSWWANVVHEGEEGDHTPVVQIGLRYGMLLFILSEVMFFVAWFWNFFKHRMYPMGPESPLVDGIWPPAGVVPPDPWQLPLINTMILLLSACAVTWAHHALAEQNDRRGLVMGLSIAIVLGICFSAMQIFEYSEAPFTFSGDIYGASFFMATGFHGFHVMVGTIFLFVCLMRALNGQLTQKQHIGLEAAAWYWHFVDVVWLFLFFGIYVWGRG